MKALLAARDRARRAASLRRSRRHRHSRERAELRKIARVPMLLAAYCCEGHQIVAHAIAHGVPNEKRNSTTSASGSVAYQAPW